MRSPAAELFALRGLLLAGLVPLFALGLQERHLADPDLAGRDLPVALGDRDPRLHHRDDAGRPRDRDRRRRLGADRPGRHRASAMTLAALLLLPSAKLRAWLRVTLAKHLFEHRYDYRQEWLRFTDTVGRTRRRRGARWRSAWSRRSPTSAARRPACCCSSTSIAGWRPRAAGTGARRCPNRGDGAEELIRHIEQGAYRRRFRRGQGRLAGRARGQDRGAALARRRSTAPGRAFR